MAESSTIGANFSQYTGDPNLGGGSLGAFVLDTRPLQDFARYTMLYNREEQARKQREAEKAAEELGKIADYDLTTSIQKDAKVLQEKYDKLISYVKQNPGALQFKNRDQWIEYQRLKNELGNDIRGARVRNVMNMAREKQIADEKDENVKNFMRSELDKEIAAKDIRTPIFYTQEYDMTIPDFSKNKGQSLIVNRWLDNQIAQNDFELWDPAEARKNGIAVSMGVDFDETTTSGQLKQQKFDANFYVKGAEVLKQAIDNAKAGIDPSLDEGKKRELLRSKLSGIGIFKGVEALNNYLTEKQQEIKAGMYTDRFGNKLNPDDYAPINWEDGLSPEELNMVADYLGWAGDKQGTKIIQTNDAIEQGRLGVQWFNARTGRIQEDRLAKAAGVNDDMALSAKKYAEALMKKLNDLKNVDGIIPKSQLSKLSADELKYLGVATTEENKFSLTPLNLKDVNFLLIENGNVKAFTGSTQEKFGTQKGASINVATIATNKLGDEMITTTGKEGYNFNNLIPLYESSQRPAQIQPQAAPDKKETPSKGDEKLTDAEYYMKYKKAKPKN